MTLSQILEIKTEIDRIKEYVDSEICHKCEEMKHRLELCEQMLIELNNTTEGG